MKKTLVALLLVITMLLACSSLALASGPPQVRVNAELVSFPDAQPYIDANNRTMMPVRFITEDMGARVSWDHAARTATVEKDGVKVEITIGQQDIRVTENGETQTVTMDTVAVLNQGRTYVPIRFVAEALGAWVGYADYYKTVAICQDILTPADIDRLQAYPSQQANVYSQPPPEYAGFHSFANAREYALRTKIIRTITSELGDHYYAPEANTSWGEFLATEARQHISALYTYDYTTDPNMVSSMEWNYLGRSSVNALYQKAEDSANHKAVINANFITDSSCVYQDKNLPSLFHSVRGILEVTISEPTDKKWAAQLLALDNVEYGHKYEIDMEAKFIIKVNNYTKIGSLTLLEPLSGKCTINLESL